MHFTPPARILALVTAASLASGPGPGTGPAPRPGLDARTAAALESLADGRLEAQRAGAFEAVAPLAEAELELLREAQRAAPGLEDQRAGDVHFTDREVKIILWTAAVIAVVLIIA